MQAVEKRKAAITIQVKDFLENMTFPPKLDNQISLYNTSIVMPEKSERRYLYYFHIVSTSFKKCLKVLGCIF